MAVCVAQLVVGVTADDDGLLGHDPLVRAEDGARSAV
jgi:hypothetical protein